MLVSAFQASTLRAVARKTVVKLGSSWPHRELLKKKFVWVGPENGKMRSFSFTVFSLFSPSFAPIFNPEPACAHEAMV